VFIYWYIVFLRNEFYLHESVETREKWRKIRSYAVRHVTESWRSKFINIQHCQAYYEGSVSIRNVLTTQLQLICILRRIIYQCEE